MFSCIIGINFCNQILVIIINDGAINNIHQASVFDWAMKYCVELCTSTTYWFVY